MGGLGQQLADAILVPVSDHPLRAAAGIGALLAAAVMWVNLAESIDSASTGRSVTTTAVTIDAVVTVATGHPAYPVALVVGLAVVLFAR